MQFVFIVRQDEDYQNILKLSFRPLAFTSYKAFLKTERGLELFFLSHFLHDFWRKIFLLLYSILEKIFHPYPFVKLEEINPVYKGDGVRTMLLTKKRESITLRLSQETFGEFVVVFSIKVNLYTSWTLQYVPERILFSRLLKGLIGGLCV